MYPDKHPGPVLSTFPSLEGTRADQNDRALRRHHHPLCRRSAAAPSSSTLMPSALPPLHRRPSSMQSRAIREATVPSTTAIVSDLSSSTAISALSLLSSTVVFRGTIVEAAHETNMEKKNEMAFHMKLVKKELNS
ncbi:hypothetical protein ZEAMMB73_Zm00001d007324 [Zea mays]|uniref:Uncharacterized protein n=1 Tax=Zea mays TaxID=4577 RepID=A0A1D6F5J4_MAIZE|nr:hypothetical protein ZEAMMB73_Zm00001d007324 [Zea mays]